MKPHKLIIIAILFTPLLVNAQNNLSLSNAIDMALKNNLDIQLAKNNVRIAKMTNSFGMAGGLPYIYANAADNIVSNSTIQKYNTGIKTTTTGTFGNTMNGGINANITLFNGFKVLATKKRLSLIQQQSEVEFNGQVQTIIANVMLKYYDIIRQQSFLKIAQSSLDVSRKKLDIINEKNSVGMANGVELLQAQADVNSSEQNLALQQLSIEQSKADLLLLMHSATSNSININDTISIDSSLQLDSIKAYIASNPQLKAAGQQIKISEQLLKETSALRLPVLKLNSAYNFSGYDYNSGYSLFYQNYGPSAGLSLQIPIYNGSIFNTQRSIAKLNVSNAKLEKERLESSLLTSVSKMYQSYATTLLQIASQQKSYVLAQKLMDLVLQNFALKQATILDVKTAQSTFESAAYQLVNLQYAAKATEIQLKAMIFKLSY